MNFKLENLKTQKRWSKKKLAELARNFCNLESFKADEPSAYNAAVRHGWLISICSHMNRDNGNLKWTEEKVREVAKTFTTRTEFHNKMHGAYCAAQRYEILEDVCSHMDKSQTAVIQNKTEL